MAWCYYLKKERYNRARLVDKLGRRHGMDITVTESKLLRISRQETPVQIIIDQKQLKNVEYFMYLGTITPNNARCTHENINRISIEKAVFKKKATLFTNKFYINLRKN